MFFIVDTPGEKLTTKMLETKNVYILDCHSEIFVWYVKILSKILSLGFSFFREIFFCSIEQLEKRYEKFLFSSSKNVFEVCLTFTPDGKWRYNYSFNTKGNSFRILDSFGSLVTRKQTLIAFVGDIFWKKWVNQKHDRASGKFNI